MYMHVCIYVLRNFWMLSKVVPIDLGKRSLHCFPTGSKYQNIKHALQTIVTIRNQLNPCGRLRQKPLRKPKQQEQSSRLKFKVDLLVVFIRVVRTLRVFCRPPAFRTAPGGAGLRPYQAAGSRDGPSDVN